MENENKTYALKVEKLIAKSPAEVFRALREGRLFMNCSADSESLQIDFRVGGKYSIEFLGHNIKTGGEFLEIIPDQKIVFTWCQDYNANPIPDTTVAIELKEQGGKTALTLTHSGFTDLENKDGHEGGWNGGLDDLTQEIVNGKIRLNRKISTPLEKLYAICKNPQDFFGRLNKKSEFKGELLEEVPQTKLVYQWQSLLSGETVPSTVTLSFEADDDPNASWLELIQEGLLQESQQKTVRAGWDTLLKHLK